MNAEAQVLNTGSSDIANSFWEIINNYQDLLQGGFKKEHGVSPFNFGTQADSAIAKSEVIPLRDIETKISECTLCPLSKIRSAAIAGKGSSSASVLIVCPNPSMEDDEFGMVMQGEDGAYLEKWLNSISLELNRDCYLTSVVKCMTPANRNPFYDEISACHNFLQEQLKSIKPKIVVALGDFVYSTLTGHSSETFLREIKDLTISSSYLGVKVLPLYHPITVLQNQILRREVWNSLNLLKRFLASCNE